MSRSKLRIPREQQALVGALDDKYKSHQANHHVMHGLGPRRPFNKIAETETGHLGPGFGVTRPSHACLSAPCATQPKTVLPVAGVVQRALPYRRRGMACLPLDFETPAQSQSRQSG